MRKTIPSYQGYNIIVDIAFNERAVVIAQETHSLSLFVKKDHEKDPSDFYNDDPGRTFTLIEKKLVTDEYIVTEAKEAIELGKRFVQLALLDPQGSNSQKALTAEGFQ